MDYRRLTASGLALVLAVTPALVRAAAVCQCGDHQAHQAIAVPTKRSCCHGKETTKAQATEVAATEGRAVPDQQHTIAGCPCCEGAMREQATGPATFEQRSVELLIPLLHLVAKVYIVKVPQDAPLIGPTLARGPPEPLHLLHCSLLI